MNSFLPPPPHSPTVVKGRTSSKKPEKVKGHHWERTRKGMGPSLLCQMNRRLIILGERNEIDFYY